MKRIAIAITVLLFAPLLAVEGAYHCITLLLPAEPEFASFSLPEDVSAADAWHRLGLRGEPQAPHQQPWTVLLCVVKVDATAERTCLRDADVAVVAARRWIAPHNAGWNNLTWHSRFWAASIRTSRIATEEQLLAYSLASSPPADSK